MKRAFRILIMLPVCFLALPVVLIIRAVGPWLLIRWGGLVSTRIGHFAANTELYLCEQDAGVNVPKQKYLDLFYLAWGPICNRQLVVMWKRVLRIWPSWILAPINRVNRLLPASDVHEIGGNTQGSRDVHNLLERFPPHLKFTAAEMARGEAGLRAIGIPPDAPFVCLIVREAAYLDAHQPESDWNYHSYRDSNIQNYVLAAEELADRGYRVIRMGARVGEAMKTTHPKIIDYAKNGMRSDFMDIYLGSKCDFCVSTATGWDEIPNVFRRPLVAVNLVPLGYIPSYLSNTICITRHHCLVKEKRNLTMREIFACNAGFSMQTSDYASKGIELIENTPEEVRDVVIEMAERLNGIWRPHEEDEALQQRFWKIFPKDTVDANQGRPFHGEIRARFGAHFLRNNRDWLQ